VIGDFYRLSEDLDFTVSMPVDSSREQRRRQAAAVKDAVAGVAERLSAFSVHEPLRGSNNSTQYVGAVGYSSPVSGQAETIKVEISLREPLLAPIMNASVRTILLEPVSAKPFVPEIKVPCISKDEALAEKFRAALTRREVAIRDFYDLDYAVRKLGLKPQNAELVALVRQKMAIPGNDAVDVGPHRLADLRRQMETRLRPVLRQRDYEEFDLDRAFTVVTAMARLLR